MSLSTLNRWKRRDTQQFEEIVQRLDEAGWLTVSRKTTLAVTGDADAGPLTQALEEIAVVLRRLVSPESTTERLPAAASTTKRRRKSG
jgi:uncharacterized phage protein gp47/JayE